MNIKTSLIAGSLALTLLTGCAPSFVTVKPLNLPKKKHSQTKIAKGISFSIARPQLIIKTKISPDLERGLRRRLQYDANTISCHLTSEIENILVSKGIAVSDIFQSREDMTFTQKKETTALLYPVITIDVLQSTSTTYQGQQTLKTSGNLMGKAEVGLVMLEPLSGEKIWIKHIYSGKKSILVDYNGVILNNNSPFQIQTNLKNTAANMDDLLIQIDKQILEAVDKYVTKEEFEYLNEDIKKLKGIKRY